MRVLLCAAFLGTALCAEDIAVPLDGGDILIHADFNSKIVRAPFLKVPYNLINQTSSWWRSIKLQFEIGGLCHGEPRQWSPDAVRVAPVGFSKSFQANEQGMFYVNLSGEDQADGCSLDIIDAALILAENETSSIKGPGSRVDLGNRLLAIKAQRDAEAAEQAKQDATEAQRQKALAGARAKKQAEEDTRLAKITAEEQNKAAAERSRIRAACSAIYDATANKKVSDLTVKESQEVQACTALSLYPPR
jgi:hypothetical protein